jgi:hypothetical protein
MATRVISQPPILPRIPPNRGDTIYDKVERFGKDIGKFCTLTGKMREQPARVGTAVATGVAGAGSVASGNWVFGFTCLTLAGREIYNLSKKPEDPVKVLQNAAGDVETIELLAHSQEEHLRDIKKKLDVIKADVADLHLSLDEIGTLNETGITEIESHQKKARELNEKAVKTYTEAEKLFIQAEQASQKAQAHFATTARCLADILELGKDPQCDLQVIKDKMALAIASTKNGVDKQREAETVYATAFGTFQLAYALKTQSMTEIVAATVLAKQVMKASAEKAKYTNEFQVRWDALVKRVEALERDLKENLIILKDLKAEFRDANEAIKQKFDYSDIIVSVTGAIATLRARGITLPAVGGAAVVGLTTGPIWHIAEGASHTTQCIDHLMFDEPPRPFLPSGKLCAAQCDTISSGKWGAYVQQRPSKTVGNILVNLDCSIQGCVNPKVVRFNLNDRKPVSRFTQVSLFLDITKNIKNGKIHPTYALELLTALSTPQSVQGSKQMVQVFEKDGFFMRRIVDLCTKKLEK